MDDHRKISRKYSLSKSKVIKLDKPFSEDSIILTDGEEKKFFFDDWDRPTDEKSDDQTCEFRSCVNRKHAFTLDEKLLKTTQSLKKEIPFTSSSITKQVMASGTTDAHYLINFMRRLLSC